MSEAQRLRELLKARKQKKADTPPLRFPFILDDALAGETSRLSALYDQVAGRVEYLKEQSEKADESGDRDVRASGHDASGLADRLEVAQAELERVQAELEAAVERVQADTIHVVFAPCGSDAYEQLLMRFPDADESMASNIAFQNALLARCFVRFEKDGQALALYDSWDEFLKDAALDFGELDPWRTAVRIACNRNPHHLLPR